MAKLEKMVISWEAKTLDISKNNKGYKNYRKNLEACKRIMYEYLS